KRVCGSTFNISQNNILGGNKMVEERIINILKRMTFKHFVIIDIDNLNDSMVSATVQNSVTGQTYPVHFPLDMLERWYSYNNLIKRLRRYIALHHSYIMSAVDYDSIVLDLVDLGEIDSKILLKIEFKGDTNDEV